MGEGMTRQLRPVIAKPVPKPFDEAEKAAIDAYLAEHKPTKPEPLTVEDAIKRAVPRRVRASAKGGR
jgi:hypothetical protein